jgi:hypothetical protein
MRHDAEWILDGCSLVSAFLFSRGQMDRMAAYAERGARREKLVAEAEAQLWTVPAGACLAPHGLPPEAITTLAGVLGHWRQIGRAYLVRRQLPELLNRTYFCLFLDWRLLSFVFNEAALLQKVASAISFSDGSAWFFSLGSDWRLRRIVKRVPGSLVYRRRLFGRATTGAPAAD